MKNVLIINGHEYHEIAKGGYNAALCEAMESYLKNNDFQVKNTIIEKGYKPDEEVDKFLWADFIIFQFPKYWMGIPSAFKRYLDYGLSGGHGKLYAHDGRNDGGKYGSGGLLHGKKYMFSITMNAPKESFCDRSRFFEGKSVDELFFGLHKAFNFLGMKPLKTFVCFDIMSNPKLDIDKERVKRHLELCGF